MELHVEIYALFSFFIFAGMVALISENYQEIAILKKKINHYEKILKERGNR
jgi:hypothetical protein